MCSKRVFSNSNIEVDYINYYNIKNGCEILKTIKQENNIAIINKFKNYKTWQTLNEAYFKYINDNITVNYLTDIYSANSSFINKCNENESENNDKFTCEEYTLYPYGKILNKNQISPTYSTDIYLCKWCNKSNKVINLDSINKCNKSNKDINLDSFNKYYKCYKSNKYNKYYKSNKDNKCDEDNKCDKDIIDSDSVNKCDKNRKPLFI